MIITMARRPILAGQTVAFNVVQTHAGALNIDSCRIGTDTLKTDGRSMGRGNSLGTHWNGVSDTEHVGRHPANLILQHDIGCSTGSCVSGCPVEILNISVGLLVSGSGCIKRSSSKTQAGNTGAAYGAENRPDGTRMISYGDTGYVSRFFYQIHVQIQSTTT